MENKTAPDAITTASGLTYTILNTVEGGIKPKKGDSVTVHYRGTFEDGTEFDSSYKRNSPIEFPLGVGMVIDGWDEGIALLSPGEKATLIIPPSIGYGDSDRGPIPANSTLYFEVELLKIN
jgi:FKBP-type peptidyl-prolyl cis-trans isomerase